VSCPKQSHPATWPPSSALREAARHEASDALFVNEQDHVLEGTRSNFFVFRGDTLITPRAGVLLGITRNTVLQLARGRFTVEDARSCSQNCLLWTSVYHIVRTRNNARRPDRRACYWQRKPGPRTLN